MQSLQPINNNVVIKVEDETEEKKTSSGLYIPDTAREKPLQGDVVAISTEIESSLAVGDRVIYKKFAGTEVSYDDVDYVILPVEDILAKIVSVDKIPD